MNLTLWWIEDLERLRREQHPVDQPQDQLQLPEPENWEPPPSPSPEDSRVTIIEEP